MRKSVAILAVPLAAIGIAAVPFGASGAPHTPKLTGGTEHLYIGATCANCNQSSIILTGAFTDYGETTGGGSSNKGGARLQKGTISVSLAGIKQTSMSYNLADCWYTFTAGGTIVITGGTGAYVGIGGSIKFSETYTAVGARLASGACNTANNAPNVDAIHYGSGTGTVKF